MPTETDIVNGAFALLKVPRITQITDNMESAELARLRYPVCRDAVLELTPWHFANVRWRLSQSAIVPASTWAYQFPLPSNPWCIRVRDPDPTYIPWEVGYDPIDGRVLFTDAPTMTIRYTARILDVSIWSPLAIQALSYLLAAELAMALTGDAAKAKLWGELYLRTIGEALSSDAQEGSPVIAQAPQALSAWR